MFESFFGVNFYLTNPVSCTKKGLIVFVLCSLQGPKDIRGYAIVFHVEAGLGIRKGLVEPTMSRTRLRFSRRELKVGWRNFDASDQYYRGLERAVEGKKR